MNSSQTPWTVLLVGGVSGSGKSSLSYALARQLGVTVTAIDDLHTAARSLTTPEQQPVLHFWSTNPQAMNLSAEETLDLHRSVCRVLEPALEAVVADHVEAKTPVILEGDYLLPKGANRLRQSYPNGTVQAVFLYEDEAQLLQNFRAREPAEGEQPGRAHVGWLFGRWLAEECGRLGLTALPARPWETLLERLLEAVGTPDVS